MIKRKSELNALRGLMRRHQVTPSMRSAVSDLSLSRLLVIHAGEHTFPMTGIIRAIALKNVLADIRPIR